MVDPGRVGKADQALVASDGAATHLHPSGFDPSREALRKAEERAYQRGYHAARRKSQTKEAALAEKLIAVPPAKPPKWAAHLTVFGNGEAEVGVKGFIETRSELLDCVSALEGLAIAMEARLTTAPEPDKSA